MLAWAPCPVRKKGSTACCGLRIGNMGLCRACREVACFTDSTFTRLEPSVLERVGASVRIRCRRPETKTSTSLFRSVCCYERDISLTVALSEARNLSGVPAFFSDWRVPRNARPGGFQELTRSTPTGDCERFDVERWTIRRHAAPLPGTGECTPVQRCFYCAFSVSKPRRLPDFVSAPQILAISACKPDY